MKHIPKSLWELGSSNLETTEVGSSFRNISVEWKRHLLRVLQQVTARFLSRLFQRKACRAETTKQVCARFAPYFSVTHPTRGTFPGPFFKLPTGHRRLVLDVVATMLYDQDVVAGAGEFLSVVEKSLAGHKEEKEYWNQISRGVCRPISR